MDAIFHGDKRKEKYPPAPYRGEHMLTVQNAKLLKTTITLPAPYRGQHMLSVQNAKLLKTGSFDKTPNFAPVALHEHIMNSEKIYRL